MKLALYPVDKIIPWNSQMYFRWLHYFICDLNSLQGINYYFELCVVHILGKFTHKLLYCVQTYYPVNSLNIGSITQNSVENCLSFVFPYFILAPSTLSLCRFASQYAILRIYFFF